MKSIIHGLAASAFSLTLLAACGPTSPLPVSSSGGTIEGDKGISGEVTGSDVGANTKIAVFGAFTNVSGNKINLDNKTIEEDTTLAVAPVSAGKYTFALPKGPQKAQLAAFKIFAFNDANANNLADEGEVRSKEATVRWTFAGGYNLAQDADGNQVPSLLSDFKDFDFKLGE